MATVLVQIANLAEANAAKAKRRARLVVGPTTAVELPWWPSSVDWANIGQRWSELPRAGKYPLLVKDGPTLPTLTIDFLATANGERQRIDPNASAWSVIKPLKAAAEKGVVVYLLLGAAYATTPWRITTFDYSEDDWTPEGTVSRASVSMVLTRVSDASMPRGPVPPKKVKP